MSNAGFIIDLTDRRGTELADTGDWSSGTSPVAVSVGTTELRLVDRNTGQCF